MQARGSPHVLCRSRGNPRRCHLARPPCRLFLGAAEDRLRQRVGLEPFPAPVAPPAPVSEERKKEILSGEQGLVVGRGRVAHGVRGDCDAAAAAAAAAAAGPVTKSEEPTHLPTPHPLPADVRVIKSVAAGRGGRVRDEKEAAQASSITVTSDGREKVAAAAGGAPANVAEARAWIAAWKAKQGGTAEAGGEDVPANVAEAREWIRRWRAATLEKKLPAAAKV